MMKIGYSKNRNSVCYIPSAKISLPTQHKERINSHIQIPSRLIENPVHLYLKYNEEKNQKGLFQF